MSHDAKEKSMKYVKTLGLLAVAMALSAFASTDMASATVLCSEPGAGSPTGTTCPASKAYAAETQVHAVLASGAAVEWETEIWTSKCTGSTLGGKTTAEGSAEEAVPIVLEAISYEKCSNSFFCQGPAISVLQKGTLSIHWIEGTHNGTVISTGTELTTTCSLSFGTVHCIYVTENTHIGTLTGGNPATLDISAVIPAKPTNERCGKAVPFRATYEITSPKPLYVASHT